MADRVKYFVLGLLFLVVAAVIAYDSWNSTPADIDEVAERSGCGGGELINVTTDAPDGSAGGHAEELPPPDEPLGIPPGPRGDAERGRSGGADGRTPDGRGRGFDLPGPDGRGGDAGRRTERDIPDTGREERTRREQPKPADDGRDSGAGEERERTERKPERGGTDEPSTREVVHVVKANENLEKIALRYYGTRRGIAWIATANDLRDPDVIFEKQKLVIPARAELKASVAKRNTRRATSSSAKTNKSARTGGIPSRYTVKPGEDLYRICRRFYGRKGEGARVARVMNMNGLYSARVRAGTVLRLPPK